MPGRPRKVENWDDPKNLAKLRELVELGHDDNEIGRAFGYGEGRAFKLALRRQNAQSAVEILYSSRIGRMGLLLSKLWMHAEADGTKEQIRCVVALMDRFEKVAAAEPAEPNAFMDRIELSDGEAKPPTSDDLLAALRPSKEQMQ